MGGTGARRYGAEASTPELEQRLRRIEQVLVMKADANSYIDDPSAANRDVPLVTGVTVTKDINKWSLTWDAVDIPDLRKYEILVASDANFSTIVGTYDEVEVGFTFPAADVGVAYYVKVRAMNKDKWTGPWSSGLSVETGLVTTGDIEAGAVTQFVEWYEAPGASIENGGNGEINPYNDPPDTEVYGPLTISTSSGSMVLPFIMLDITYQSVYGYLKTVPDIQPGAFPTNKIDVEVNRRPVGGGDTLLMAMTFDFHSSVPYDYISWWGANPPATVIPAVKYTTARARLHIPVLIDQPGAGTFEYRLTATATGSWNTYIYMLPTNLRMRFFEYKV